LHVHELGIIEQLWVVYTKTESEKLVDLKFLLLLGMCSFSTEMASERLSLHKAMPLTDKLMYL